MSLWGDRGVSLFHGNPILYKDKNEPITLDHVLKYVTPKQLEIESYGDWFNARPKSIEILMQQGDICLHTPPQLYKKNKVFSLIDKTINYDLVIMTRPDLFYVDELNLELFTDKNTVWNVNPQGWQYYPNRIYDIFYMGSPGVVRKMSECYFSFETMTGDPYDSKLRMLDCCKILYIYAMANNIKVDTTPNVIGDIYRNDESVIYVCGQCHKDRKEIGI